MKNHFLIGHDLDHHRVHLVSRHFLTLLFLIYNVLSVGGGSNVNLPHDGGGHDPFLNSNDVKDAAVNVNHNYNNDNVKLNSQIATHPACQAEVTRICEQKSELLSDLEALECVLDKKRNEVDEITDQCNHQMWTFRKDLTQNKGFLQIANSVKCGEVFEGTKCWKEYKDDGFNLIVCLYETRDTIEKEMCRSLVKRVESVIFGDFELLGRFAEKCELDIQKLSCGRNEGTGNRIDDKMPISQGKTIECLSEKISQLGDDCAKEILRVAELQTEDYHLDRALYFACRNDREKFCSSIPAGNGMVYKCLLKNKMEREMSDECRNQIYRRQKTGWYDYKASGIVYSCKSEIKKYRCRKETVPGDKHVRLSQILLCLENAVHTNHDINGDCLEEMKQHRQALMEDYRISPEILKMCSIEKNKFCNANGKLSAKTIHCLMDHATSRKERLSEACKSELEDFLKILDISDDWRVDPVLKQNCQPAVDKSYCAKLPPNKILDCLMNMLTNDADIGTDVLTEECEKNLLQIQYFISRDFPIDSNLFEDCHQDAVTICGAKSEWDTREEIGPARGPLILSCLYRNLLEDKHKISKQCAHRVKDVMRQRALSVRLMPEMEEPCLEDLSDLCSDKTRPGEEIDCLQDHIDELKSSQCKIAVFNYTQIESKDPTVDPYLWKYCKDTIEKKCSSEEERSDETDVIDCLIELKGTLKGKKCRASVDHVQLLRLKDIEFSPKFKLNCHESVIRYCKKERPFTPLKLANCLSEIVRNDTILDHPHRIGKSCRKQIRYLTNSKLQVESEKIDQTHISIYTLCSDYVRKYCPNVVPGGGRIFECLREHVEVIEKNTECYSALFKIQIDLNNNISPDLAIEKDCAEELNMFCPQSTNPFPCLEDAMNSNKPGFNQDRCGHVIRLRMIEQNMDARLNPLIRKDCKYDIQKFCSRILPGEGRVLACLKRYFVIPKNGLSQNCRNHIESIIEGAAKTDIRLDNNLYTKCKIDIENTKCKDAKDFSTSDGFGDGGAIEECLKSLYHDNRLISSGCKAEISELIQSSMIDIHVDPILEKACSLDVLKLCDGIPRGEGRLIGCLLNELESAKEGHGEHLSPECREKLSKRSELFKMAGVPLKLDSIQDLYTQVQLSPHKNYFLSVGMTLFGFIFLFGLFCGRVNRRIESKNK